MTTQNEGTSVRIRGEVTPRPHSIEQVWNPYILQYIIYLQHKTYIEVYVDKQIYLSAGFATLTCILDSGIYRVLLDMRMASEPNLRETLYVGYQNMSYENNRVGMGSRVFRFLSRGSIIKVLAPTRIGHTLELTC